MLGVRDGSAPATPTSGDTMTAALLDPPVDDATRREVLVGAGALTLGAFLTGCGADAPTPETADQQRTIRHALGRTRVPADPRRIVAVEPVLLEALYVLGARPVATTRPNFVSTEHLPPEVFAGVEQIGTLEELDYEAVAAQRPDLVLTTAFEGEEYPEGSYARLSAIAPTVATNFVEAEADPRADVAFLGRVLGREERARARVAALEQRFVEIKRRLAPVAPRTTLSYVRLQGAGSVYPPVKSAGARLLGELGFDRPPGQAFDPDAGDCCPAVSLERLAEIDGDVLFLGLDSSDESAAVLARLRSSALFNRLRAVRAGRVHTVSSGAWAGDAYLGAQRMFDDLERHVLR
jgi:iron complex transport system substrate-binding protein